MLHFPEQRRGNAEEAEHQSMRSLSIFNIYFLHINLVIERVWLEIVTTISKLLSFDNVIPMNLLSICLPQVSQILQHMRKEE